MNRRDDEWQHLISDHQHADDHHHHRDTGRIHSCDCSLCAGRSTAHSVLTWTACGRRWQRVALAIKRALASSSAASSHGGPSSRAISCIAILMWRVITSHQLHSYSHTKRHHEPSAADWDEGLGHRGWRPDPPASHLIFVSHMNIRDGASCFSACNPRVSPH